MSTHNIGFYEDLTKIIFELSSDIIKYAPYFFCWVSVQKLRIIMVEESITDTEEQIYEPCHKETCLPVSDQVRHKPFCTAKFQM